jgi:hypothetical protein
MLRLAAVLLPLLLIVPAMAETPAERASRQLEEGQFRDRAEDAAREAMPVPPPPRVPPQMQPLEADRRSIQPDIGRPEQRGVPTTGGFGPPTGAQNPQR